MERLSAEDRLMLWPDERWPQDVGALAVLDGRDLVDPGGRFRIEAVRQVIGARLHLVPRFRQRLVVPRRGLGGPLWVDAPGFDLGDHVRVAPVPAPGDEAALLRATEALRRRRLDRSRPLWEMWFLPGLPEQRTGLFVRMHHAVADGIAAVAAVGAFLDETPVPVPARPWTPAPMPTARELFADNLRRRADGLGRALSTVGRPLATARRVRAAWPAMRAAFSAVPTPATSLDRTVGPDRAIAVIRTDLDLVRRIAHAHDAKVNDVLLAVTAGGLRGLLDSRGEPVEDLPIYVPVTLRRREGRAQARGNLIGQMIVPLPVGPAGSGADPGQRLRRIAATTAAAKALPHPNLGAVLRSRTARRALLRILERHPVSVTTADVPGPPLPVHLAGARVLEVFPMLPLIARVSLGVGALSYAGRFTVTAIADRDTCPDLDVFVAGAEAELRALATSTALVRS